MEDSDSDDDEELITTAVTHHMSTITSLYTGFIVQQQQLDEMLRQHQQCMAVLVMVQQLEVKTSTALITNEALLLFHYLSSLNERRWYGSNPGRAANRDRGRQEAHEQLVSDYFSVDPTYSESQFRRRYRMSRTLFLRIVEEVENADVYFQQRPDATGKLGATALQKVTAACRILAYGSCADQLDEWIRLGESTIMTCEKVCGGCHSTIWKGIHAITNRRRHDPHAKRQCRSWISWMPRKHRLLALGVEELPFRLGRSL